MMKRTFVFGVIVSITLVCVGSIWAAPLATRNYTIAGEDVTQTLYGGDAYFYGFNQIPTTNPPTDLDFNGAIDFHPLHQPDYDLVNGMATDISTGGAEHLMRTDFARSLWRANFMDAYFTVEAKVNIMDTGDEGSDGVFGLYEGNNLGHVDIRIGRTGILNKVDGTLLRDGIDNTGWHTWRVAVDSDGAWIMRDGVLLNSTALALGSTWNRTFAGDYSHTLSGDWQMEYYVLDKSGAYIPEPLSLTLLGLGAMALLRRRRNS